MKLSQCSNDVFVNIGEASEAYMAYRAAIAETINTIDNLHRALLKPDECWDEIRSAAEAVRHARFPLERAEQRLDVEGSDQEKLQHIEDSRNPNSLLHSAYRSMQELLEKYYERKAQKVELETHSTQAYPLPGNLLE